MREEQVELTLAASQYHKEKSYWLGKLAGITGKTAFFYDFTQSRKKSSKEYNRKEFRFTGKIFSQLMKLSKAYDYTLHMILAAAVVALLARYTGNNDIIIGTPIYKQDTEDDFINTVLALRNRIEPDMTFKDVLLQVKQTIIEASENQNYPIDQLAYQLNLPVSDDDFPLFDTAVLLENIHDKKYLHPVPLNIIFSFLRSHESVEGVVEYNPDLYKKATIHQIVSHCGNLLKETLFNVQVQVSNINILSQDERRRLLVEFNGITAGYPGDDNLVVLFERQVEKTPHRIALSYNHHQLSYGKLNEEANPLARILGKKGVCRDTLVGLMMERSIEMIVAILAILKAGGAYLPLDPGYPRQRILSMLNDSEVTLLLTTRDLLGQFPVTLLKNMKAGERQLVITPSQAQIKDFDSLPIPDRTLIDYQKYHQYIGEAPAKHTITLQATRGCPYNCLYCHKIWPKTHVARSSENIFKEISYAYDAGVRRFVFIDDIFNLKRKNAARFLETVIKSKMDIQLFFPNGFRADILDRDFIDLMAAAGTVDLDVALESASPRIQKLIRKNLNLEKFKENVQYITAAYPHIILEMEMMHGFPTETEEEAIMTLDFLKSLKWVHFPNLHVLKIFPNTDICRLAIENGISPEAIERSADLAFHELPDTLPFSKSFTRQFQAKFTGEYFLSKERLLHVLPIQMKILTEDELVQKYDSYLSWEVKNVDDILRCGGISREELGDVKLMQPEQYQALDFGQKIRRYFPVKTQTPPENAFRILLLDLSQFFSQEHETMLHHQIEDPLGLLYLMTYLNDKFKDRIHGKVLKSRIDFDSYHELKSIIFDLKPDLIGIRTLSFYKEFFHKTVLLIRQWGVEVPIVAGGPYATSDYNLILQDPYVDIVVLGEGELTLAHLVEKMMENNHRLPGEDELQGIRGIAFCPGTKQRHRDILLLDEICEKLGRYPAENLKSLNRHDDLLYVIYTSGSTGTPKGVMLQHCSLVNLIRYQYSCTDIDFSRVLQFTTISFDVSAQEIFSTLLAGGCLSLISRETLTDVPALFRRVEKDGIKTLFLPTSFLKFIMNEEDFLRLIPANVDHIVTAGEQAIVNERFKRYLNENRIYFHNHYGPAETHVVTALAVKPGEDLEELPPIGRPLANTSIYILDNGNQLVPVGVPGELFIGGIQVGRGYLNRPELTDYKFQVPKYRSYRSYFSKKLYKTGDLARWLEDGKIEFLGRIDFQVKIRGFRIEPGEIEAHLLNYKGIREAVVESKENESGEKYLCAYIVSEDELSTVELKEYLSRDLPEYMVPAYFMQIPEIPVNSSGKILRRALPQPRLQETMKKRSPRDELEKTLAGLWSEILGIDKNNLSIDDNFFDLGGHSLKATILSAKIHKEFKVKVSLAEVFNRKTIRNLSEYIKNADKISDTAEDRNLVPLKKVSTKAPHLFFIHDGSGEVNSYMEFCQYLDSGINCWGIEVDKGDDVYTPRNLSMGEIARQYIEKIRQLEPQGPYFIAGWSVGGTIAFEIAWQLEQMDREIQFLAIIDSMQPLPPSSEKNRKTTEKFTLESELKLIREYFPGIKNHLDSHKITELIDIWPVVIDYLEANHINIEILKNLIPGEMLPAIPNHDQIAIKELIDYVNVIRTHLTSQDSYIVPGKINAPIHYFEAARSGEKEKEQWNNYSKKPMKVYEIDGDHFSIFRQPAVVELAEAFNNALKGCAQI